MKSSFWLTIVLTGSLFLCLCTIPSCNKKGELQVTSRNFEDQIEQQQNLSFSFNKELVPDSLLNAWDSTDYIEFTPAVKGMFKWNSASELVFSPREKFEPGTEYTARLTSLLLKHSKKKYTLSGDEIHFHTAPLTVTSTHVSWARGKNVSNVMVQMDMAFNYDVDLAQAANRLKLSSRGAPVSISAVNNGGGKVLSVQFMPVNDKDEETPLRLELGKGIPVPGSRYASQNDTSLVIMIPSRYNLTVTNLAAQHTGTDGIITVSTSQPVMEANLKSLVTVQPAVPFDVILNDAGFTITSNQFSATQTYVVNISSQLEGIFGGKMKNEYAEQITFGKLAPSLTFINNKGMYISSGGYKNLSLNIVNIQNVDVTVVKVYENNLEQLFRQGSRSRRHHRAYGDEGDDGEGGDADEESSDDERYSYFNTDELGDVIFRKTYETSKLPKQNSAHTLHLDFEDQIKDYNGVYVLTVQSREQSWIQQSRIISISDVGLIVKQEEDNIYVFANSIHTARPLQDVNISFVSSNNQKLNTIATDAEGVAVFKDISKHSPGFYVTMVTAKMNNEFTAVYFGNTEITTSRFNVGGRTHTSNGLNAMIYPERNLYRPGEPIHVSTIVRDEEWNPQKEMPVKFRLTMPNGKEFNTVKKILNEQGSAEASFDPPPTAMTGTYTVGVYSGNDLLLNTYEISVEEFMPDRMKVSLNLDKKEYNPGDEITATIQADNLFGTPAEGRNYQCELNMEKETFESDKFPSYSFYISNDYKFNADMEQGKTDENGAAKEVFSIDSNTASVGVLNGNIMATVFDENGRPVHRYSSFKVYTQPVYVGINCHEDYVSVKRPVTLSFIALDKNSVPQNQNVEIVAVKKEWHTVIEQNGSVYRYVSKYEERILSKQTMHISGTNTKFMFTPKESGDYEIRVSKIGTNYYVAKSFYAYGWETTQYTSFEVNNEGHVDMHTDKKEYNVGEPVNVLFTTPFEGRMLVTLERDHMMKYYYVDTKDKSASITFNAEEAHLPNVYVSATLFRPMDGSDMPLTVAHGYKSIKVSNKNYNMPVSVSVAEKSRSKTRQTINVKTLPGAFVTIAAVDEGILQVKNFETPDPYNYFYQKVSLSVSSYDVYPWLLPEVKTIVSSTGGDGADKSKMRLNPMFVNRVKNVSFWSGILQADGSGNVKYDIDIPQFSGDLRIMAVAYKDKAFGSVDKHMKVADPIVISTALPRFLSPKDEVIMPVTMSNTTAKPASATVTVRVAGPLGVSGEQTQTVPIPANREGRAVFHVIAQPAIGAGKVTVSVRALSETFIDETDIGVRPPASLQKITGSGFAAANTATPLALRTNFIPTSVSGKLVIGKSPLTQFSKALDDLVQYPYGCVEQTTSAAFPQLYYSDLVKSMHQTTDKGMNPAYNIQQAINKLQSMQLSDGGLSYWPQGGEESWWGSIYACHFLLEAKKAGYAVNPNTLSRLEDYMKYKLVKRETLTFFFNGNQKKDVVPEEVPYSLYVLATAGQPQQATMNYYKAHPELLTLDSKYLPAAAYSLSGQPTQAKELLPPAFAGEVPDHCFSGSFYSYIRDEALSLNVLMDIDPNNKQVGIMAKQLSSDLAKERYLSTQENVFSILALGKVARLSNNTNATATIAAGGRSLGSSRGEPLTVDLKSHTNDAVAVQVKGTGGYYYFWEIDGISADGSYKKEDNFLQVRRTFYDRTGHVVANNSFRQNDLVVVGISIESQYDRQIDNVAITDMLPAGFEIENARLTEVPEMDWIKNQSEADYMDIRDDRINLFTSVGHTRKTYYYMARAVSPGAYQLGPVQADAMYDGNYHSYHGAGVVRIADK